MQRHRIRASLRALVAAVVAVLVSVLGAQLANPAQASATDCKSYSYACTPAYTGANALGTWAWTYYGGPIAMTPTGYHNCTLYAAWRLAQNGMASPGRSWGNASQWASNIGGGDRTPTVGSIAWWGTEVAGGLGHVAYVEQVSGANIFISADNWSSTAGYTSSGWIASSAVDLFLHPYDLPPAPTVDGDGDGVPDSAPDWCLYDKGTVPNRGCPNSNIQVSGDLNGDGRSDVIAISRGYDNAPSISWFPSTSSSSIPSVASPIGVVVLPAPAWNVDNLKWSVGDFNGDGKDDLAAVSGSISDPPNMYVFLSTGSGLSGPTLVKQPNPTYWLWDRLQFLTGDVDGDGKDDVYAISRNPDSSPAISWFRSTSTGMAATLADPVSLKSMPGPAWNVNNLKWTVGDFNGDGRDDLFAASGSLTDPPSLYVFNSTGTSLADPALVGQPNPAYWKWERLQFIAANLDGDSRDDILAISRGLDDGPTISWFQSTSTPTTVAFADPVALMSLPSSAWKTSNLKWAVIDANGDGHDDLFACSGSAVDPPNLYLFAATGVGAGSRLNDPVLVNQPNPAYWKWERLHF